MNKSQIIMIVAGVVVVIIIGVVLYSLIGKSNNNQATQQTTLVYWGLWEPESVMQSLIAKYEQQNPGIKIQYVQKPFTQYDANLYTRIQQNVVDNTPAPDIVRINNAWLSKYQGLLKPMPSSIMTAAEYSQTFYPTALKDFTGTDGQIYAIPLEIDGLSMFYNKKLFNAARITTIPTDLDTFVDVAKKLSNHQSSGKMIQAGAGIGTSKNVKHSADILNLLLLQNGVEVIDSTNTQVTLNTPRAVSALEYYIDFTKTHKIWSTEVASDLDMFFSGKLAIMFGPSWRAFDILNSNPSLEFGIAPVPQLPGNDPINYAMYWGEAVPATSPNADQAWRFIKFLSQPENMKEMFSNSSQIRAFGEPYSRKDLANELATHPYAGAFVTMAPTMKAWKMGEQGAVEDNLRTAINQVIEGGESASDAMLEAQTRINEKLLEVIK